MKKILLFLFSVSLSAIGMYAQDKAGIYYNNEKLGYSRIIGKNVGNIAGAYFTLGLSSAKSNKVVEGETSNTEINERKPIFTFVFGEDNLTGEIFSKSRNINDFVLLKLHDKKGKRNLRTGKYGLTGVKTGIDEKDVSPVNIEELSECKLSVSPKSKLDKGEYCFYYIGEQEEGNEFNGVFDFTIK